jgi:ABC-type polysaccharide/polyol phosphate transport system ATPase subunit
VTRPVIAVDGVGKRYVKYEDSPLLVTAILRMRTRTRRSHLWALRDASFEVAAGECVGIIGRNGSGKSTLLRLLARVTAPSEGRVRVRGPVAPLISVGVGFHPELTGRENVYVNGTVLGMSRRTIDQRFDEIVAFAEIAEFIDTPVKFYSSGMFVRLGFAIAVAAEPSVLLVDEVLAVGDVAFQQKCYDRMLQLKAAGTTIVVVSHNLSAIRLMCERTLLLHDGRVMHDGLTSEAIGLFYDLLGRRVADAGRATTAAPEPGFATIEEFTLTNSDGTQTSHLGTGEDAAFRAVVRFERPVVDPIFGLAVFTEGGIQVYGQTSPWSGTGRFAAGERARFDLRMTPNLTSGSYTAEAGVQASEGVNEFSVSTPPLLFYVAGRQGVNGIADLGGQPSVTRIAPNDVGSAARSRQ